MRGLWLITAALSVAIVHAAGDSRLADAAQRGDRAAVQTLLRQRADVNGSQADGMTALHWAAYRDEVEIGELLLRAGAKPDIANRYGLTPLGLATENGNVPMMEALLRAGVDPKAAPSGEPPILTAARTGNERAVRLLASRGADVNAKDSWQEQTAVMWAALENHASMIRVLVELGANVNAVAHVSDLLQGPGQSSQTFVQIPQGGMTALMFAAREGNLDAARALLDAKANPSYEDPEGITPVLVALHNGHYDTAALLIENGANLNDGSVYMAVQMHNLPPDDRRPIPKTEDRLGSLDILRLLLAKGADPNVKLNKEMQSRSIGFARPQMTTGMTPLQRAAQDADVEAIQLLLQHKADPNRTGRDGSLPLITAIAGGRGTLAYRQRVAGDTMEAIKLLVGGGANVNAVNFDGRSPMHFAAQQGSVPIIQMLADAGARADLEDFDGLTPLDLVDAPAAGGRGGRGGSPRNGDAEALLRRLIAGAQPAGGTAR